MTVGHVDTNSGGGPTPTGPNQPAFDAGTHETTPGGPPGVSPDVITTLPPEPRSAPPQPGAPQFTASDIERARSEEKDKLYPQMDEMKQRLAELSEREAAREKAEREAIEAERAAKEAAELEALTARELAEKVQRDTAAELAAMREEINMANALRDKEAEFATITAHRAQLLSNAEDIIPEFRDFIQGETVEELNQSYAALVERSQSVLSKVQEATQQMRRQAPTVRTTAPPMGPVEDLAESAPRELTTQDVKDMSMAEYRKHRELLHKAVGDEVRARGSIYDR